MKQHLTIIAVAVAFVLGLYAGRVHPATVAAAATESPAQGWSMHIDAIKHFGDANPNEVAHHWCKPVAGGMFECQIYESDAPNARLVAVETIVTPAVYKTFSPQEQAYWHYHKIEIPKVNATMPDVSAAESARTLASIGDTYGKVWVLWDPAAQNEPIGAPTITVLR